MEKPVCNDSEREKKRVSKLCVSPQMRLTKKETEIKTDKLTKRQTNEETDNYKETKRHILTKKETEDFDRLVKEAKEAKSKADKDKKDKKAFSQTLIHKGSPKHVGRHRHHH